MSHFLQNYILTYTPLSPIHIGTGDSYEPTNYVIDNGTLYEFDTGGALAAFSEDDRKELNKIVNVLADDRKELNKNENMLKAVQGFFYERREKIKPWAINAIPVLDGVANLYGKRVGKAANQEGVGRQVLNKLEIDRTAYNPINRQPVLFGSSIKGAIRTALLDQVNNGQQASERKGLHEFQGRLLKYRDPRGRQILEQDPLRLIQLGDATWNPAQRLPSSQVHLAVNRKIAPVVDGNNVLRPAMGENLYQILECIPALYANAFQGQMAIQRIELNAPNRLPDENLRFSINSIAKACNDFYLPQLECERELLKRRKYWDAGWNTNLCHLLKLAEEKIKTKKAFLLRVGRHSGATAVTVSGTRNIRIMRGRNQQPEYANAPKTLWLAANDPQQRTDLLPFGWLLVEIHHGNAPISEWQELHELCHSQQTQAREWAKKIASQQAEAAARLAKQQADDRRRATMSPEQLQIEDFRQQLEQKQASV